MVEVTNKMQVLPLWRGQIALGRGLADRRSMWPQIGRSRGSSRAQLGLRAERGRREGARLLVPHDAQLLNCVVSVSSVDGARLRQGR